MAFKDVSQRLLDETSLKSSFIDVFLDKGLARRLEYIKVFWTWRSSCRLKCPAIVSVSLFPDTSVAAHVKTLR